MHSDFLDFVRHNHRAIVWTFTKLAIVRDLAPWSERWIGLAGGQRCYDRGRQGPCTRRL